MREWIIFHNWIRITYDTMLKIINKKDPLNMYHLDTCQIRLSAWRILNDSFIQFFRFDICVSIHIVNETLVFVDFQTSKVIPNMCPNKNLKRHFKSIFWCIDVCFQDTHAVRFISFVDCRAWKVILNMFLPTNVTT